MTNLLSKIALGLSLGALALVAGREAQAYPQWQFSSGTVRCAQCHYNPAGGGLITNYGRDAAGEDLSTWEGNGAFLHGLIELPSPLALGGDVRFAALAQDVGEDRGAKTAFFPMQADLYGRLALGESLSIYGTVGYRGQIRNGDEILGNGAAIPIGSSRFISREHWVMWRPEPKGPYVRAGRFFAPYGLRLAEHYTYIRRDTGFNLLEETYNVSGGVVRDEWELHITAFAPDFVRDIGGQDYGAAALFEKRLFDASALGLQTRLAFGEDVNRYQGGAYWKTYFEGANTLLQTEVDLIHSVFAGDAGSGQGLVGYLNLTWFPAKGVWVGPFGEIRQTDLRAKDSATAAAGLQLNWFPYPHFEFLLLGRVQVPFGGDSTAKTGMAFIHYYL